MEKPQIINLAKDFLLSKYKDINRDYPLTRESLICNNFEEYTWKDACYRFDISPVFDVLYLPPNSAFTMAYRFLVDEEGQNVLEETIYNEENQNKQSTDTELPFYPGTGFFQSEIDKINLTFSQLFGKEVSVSRKGLSEKKTLTWNMENLEDLRDCDLRIMEQEKCYFLKHKLKLDSLLDKGYCSEYISPHSWCEYYFDKESGELYDLTIYDMHLQDFC